MNEMERRMQQVAINTLSSMWNDMLNVLDAIRSSNTPDAGSSAMETISILIASMARCYGRDVEALFQTLRPPASGLHGRGHGARLQAEVVRIPARPVGG